ncbi:unnamed protein product [Rotaria sp. Silwood1]|nr:unnamed protein product [Rotaria sp. Silwood1]
MLKPDPRRFFCKICGLLQRISLPSFLDVQPDTIYGVWKTFARGISTLAIESNSGAGAYLVGQSPNKLFDGSLSTKYASRGNSSSGINAYAGLNTGFYMTIAQCQPVLIGFRFDSTSLFVVQSGSVQALWNTVAGGASTIATEDSTGVGTYAINQSPDNLFDNNTSTKYMSRGSSTSGTNVYAGLNTGFYVTIAQCQPTLVKFRFATAANASSPNRDPTNITVEGANCDTLVNCTTWSIIYAGSTGLENVLGRSTYGPFQNISSPHTFTSYRFLVTAKRNTSDYVAYSEVELYGY